MCVYLCAHVCVCTRTCVWILYYKDYMDALQTERDANDWRDTARSKTHGWVIKLNELAHWFEQDTPDICFIKNKN